MNIFKSVFKSLLHSSDVPKHIAIVMDGNRRWAKRRGLPTSVGHRAGAQTLKKIVDFCTKIDVDVLTVYAFSTENWKRSKEEVEGIMNLLREYLKEIGKDIKEKDVKFKIIGDITQLDRDIQLSIHNLEEETKSCTKLQFNIALNYGGRQEIVYAVKNIAAEVKENNLEIENIDESTISQNLYTQNITDPDLLIRTGGELRVSNFLLWQIAYTELWFTKEYWPDFTTKTLSKAINEYKKRIRRFGGK